MVKDSIHLWLTNETMIFPFCEAMLTKVIQF